jgi:magnesium transporter
MISYYYSTKKAEDLAVLDLFKKGAWIQVERPDDAEVEGLVATYKLDEGLLRDALDPYEVPRIETDEGKTYFYTRVPYKENGQVFTSPLLIVLADDFMMTVSQRKLSLWDRFIDQRIEFYTTQKTKFFFQIFSEITRNYNNFVTEVRKNVARSTASFGSIGNSEIVQFVRFENTLNNFLSALVPTNTSLQNLLSGVSILKLYEDDKEFIEDIFLLNGQLIESCKSNLKAISNIRDAYSTIMTNNLNRVIKLLTVLTIGLTIPTIVSSLYGMNVTLPGGGHPLAFWFIIGGIALIAIIVFFIFYFKNWLN